MDNQNNKNNSPNNNRQGWGIILITTLLVAVVVMGLYSLMQGTGPEEISYDKFLKLVDSGKVEEVTLSSTRIYITLKDKADTDDSKDAASDAPENTAAGTGDGGEALGNDTGDGAGGAADNTVGGADTPGDTDTADAADNSSDASDDAAAGTEDNSADVSDNAADTEEQDGNTADLDSEADNIISQIEKQARGGREKEPDYYTGVVNDDTLSQRLEEHGVTFGAEVPDTVGSLFFEIFVTVILPIVLLVILFNFLMKKMT